MPALGNIDEFDMQTSDDENSEDEEKNTKRQETRKFRREVLEEKHQTYLRILKGGMYKLTDPIEEIFKVLNLDQ